MSNKDKLTALIRESFDECTQRWAEVIADHLIEAGVTINNAMINKDSIWITKENKEALFVDTLEGSYNLQDEELTDWMNYAFSADKLERYCSGDTGAFDSAYESIGKRLKNEYKQWYESRRKSS